MKLVRQVAIMIDLQWPLPYHQHIFAGTQEYSRKRGNWECTVDLFADEGVRQGRGGPIYDGVIARATPQLVTRARRARVPVVNVWMNSPASDVPSVFADVSISGQMVAEHLMSRGLRQFAYLGFRRDRMSELQEAAFRMAVAKAGFSCTKCLTSRTCDRSLKSWRNFQKSLEQWIGSWTYPIGVCVAHDVLARYLITTCQRRNVSVPNEVAVVSSHNEPTICLHPEPSISSIAFNYREIGYRAAALLDRMMCGQKPPAQPIWIKPVELVARKSTDVHTATDPLVAQAMRFIAESGNNRIEVSDVARHVNSTRRTLERRFRKTLGRTIAGEISRLRIERVKRRLIEGNARIAAVADEFGFVSAKRLTESFCRVEGVPQGSTAVNVASWRAEPRK